MLKTIAIAPPHESELHFYTDWVESLGLNYFILKDNDVIDENVHLLLLCGGVDFGKRLERDMREHKWFMQAYSRVPIVGICRGMQMANVLLGGTLKDITNESIVHAAHKDEIVLHIVELTEGGIFQVNTRHHLAIDEKCVDFKVLAKSQDGVIEMAEGENSLFVQWHPERKEVRGEKADLIVSDWIKSKLQ